MVDRKQCEKSRKKGPDIKEVMAMLLIQHNILHGKVWESFHKDVHKVADKYLPYYKKGMALWWKKGEINNNI